jgi:hypothetical protein
MTPLIYYIVGGVSFLATLALVLAPALIQPSTETQHILDVVGNKRTSLATAPRKSFNDGWSSEDCRIASRPLRFC